MELNSKMSEFDEPDLQILQQLEAEEELNLSELSDEIGLSKSAIHYRLNKLKENGVVTGMSAQLDPLAFGLEMMMITDVMVTHETGYAEDIGEQLTEIGGVNQVYYTMGDVDFVVISRVQNREQMNDLVDEMIAIDGVNETSSKFVMDEFKTDSRVLTNMSEEMVENVAQTDGASSE
ncbi:Lrp/AsnC family transcriptional regulator [Halovivax sp.]|uniref:Lrp/AsnC family transcriptional regulator n=1 Tax=Halovivax sp. TaxID=1935978 RepID=UPI0025B9807C|nr:Lrp/AsnC family transcriptional regulator [Halovivax sp.]